MTMSFLTDGMKVEVNLEDKLCILYDYSGLGKTLLLRRIADYGQSEGNRYVFYEQTVGNAQAVISDLLSADENALIMFDDGISYSSELISAINASKATVVCDIKSHVRFPAQYRTKYGRYCVMQENNRLMLRRVGCEDIV